MGSQIASGVNWGDLFKNIGGLFGGSSSGTGSSYTPPVQNDYWNSSNLYPWLKG
jgi:hypothetical protein